MSTISSALDPNDPRLTQQLIEHDPPAPIQSAQAIRLLAHSLTAKARALEDCEKYVFVMRCPNGHTWPVPFTCHQRFCPNCHERIILELVKKYEHLDIGEEPFLCIEISVPLRSYPLIVFSRDIGRGFKRLEKSADHPIGTIWNIVPSPSKLTAYLILWGDGIQSFERYREAWPKAMVKVSTRPAHQFLASLHSIFDHAPSKDPLFRADCEFFFHGRRSVHTMGTIHIRKQLSIESTTSENVTNELFPSKQDTGNNSDSNSSYHCPRCHEPATGISQRMHATDFRQSRLLHAWRE